MLLKKLTKAINKGGLILMYHRIVDKKDDPWDITVSPDNFEEHLQVLGKHFNVVCLKDYMQIRNKIKYNPRRYAVITFDDGYGDNYHNAKNLLEKYDMTATLFITTYYTGRNSEFWWDHIASVVYKNSNLYDEFLSIFNVRDAHSLKYMSKLEICKFLQQRLQRMKYEERTSKLSQLSFSYRGDYKPDMNDLPLNAEQIYKMSSERVFEIGAHTITHPSLSLLEYNRQKEEVESGKYLLENIIDDEVISFSYPHGDFSNTTLGILRNTSYRYACTIKKGKVYHSFDPYKLPRIKVLNWCGEDFEKYILHNT